MNAKISLKPGKENLLKRHHPWLFSGALEKPSPMPAPGSIVDLTDSKGAFLARGMFNANSQITVRILTRDRDEEINAAFFEKRFQKLQAVRAAHIDFKSTNAYRLCFAESDGLPGLIVDKYDTALVIQISTAGMDRLRPQIIEALQRVFTPSAIVERSELEVRREEGLKDLPHGVIAGKIKAPVEILENNLRFEADLLEGQKTGFFLDQRDSRRALQHYVQGKRVLNTFCYSAGFSVYAAKAGAAETVNVDSSDAALRQAKRHFQLNGINMKTHQFLEQDVFKALEEFAAEKERFDVIILDPPAFVKTRKNIPYGMKAYQFINDQAIRLLPPGGILVTCSCSGLVKEEDFWDMVGAAAARSGATLRALELRGQPIDHPFNPNFPEGRYLKCGIFRKD